MSSTLTDETEFSSLELSLPRLEAAVSPLVGIVTGSVSTTCTTDEASLPNCACELSSARRTLGTATVAFGSGAHPDARRARAAAIGEALERYSGVYVPVERLRRSTARQLGDLAARPARFALFHPSQYGIQRFPLVPFTEDVVTSFVDGFELGTGTTAFLPADLVFLSRADPRSLPIGYATSSGLACGPTFAEAVLGALLEVVERDAVMLAWKCRLSLPLLDWSCDQALMRVERSYFAPTGLRFNLIDASCFLDVPVVISVLHGPPNVGAALAVGGAAAARVDEAWLKALAESFGVYRWLRQQAVSAAQCPEPDQIESFDDHMLFYASDENAALAGFLDGGSERRATADVIALEGATPTAQIEAIVSRLAAHDVTAYAVDVTSPDVRALGLHVARVIAPELCALDVSHRARFLGGTRLASAAYDAGLRVKPLELEDLNPLPHPFP